MATDNFTVFKYRHGQRTSVSPLIQKLLWGMVIVGSILLFKLPAAGAVLLIAALLLRLSQGGKDGLLVGRRYLICGNIILYYQNLTRVNLQSSGVLDLWDDAGKHVQIEKKKFPTGARKTEKIERNTAAKFHKASVKIISKVQAIAPAVEVCRDGHRLEHGAIL